jgi:ankyrin repeat protein
MEGHTGIVKLLLSSRADVNGGGQMETNWTIKPDAPQLAAESGDINLVRYLLEKYSPAGDGPMAMVRTISYENAVWGAALYGHIHIVKLLPDHGIDPSNLRDNKCTPLPLSAFKGHTAIVKLLLDNISVRFPDKILGGNEALLVAAVRGGNLNTIRLLLKNKVNVNIPDSKSITALHAAAEIGHISILKLLINNKADVNAETEDGTTVLKRAFISQNIDAIKLLVNLKANALPITNNHYHYRDEIRDEYSNASGRGR